MYFWPDGPTPPHSPKEAPFFDVHVGPSGPSVTYGMRSRRAARALPVKRSGGIQGISMWQSAEIRVKVTASPSWVSVTPIISDPARLRFKLLTSCLCRRGAGVARVPGALAGKRWSICPGAEPAAAIGLRPRLRRATPAFTFRPMRVAILPSGALLADTAARDDETGDGLTAAARARLLRAFARGPGYFLLDLGATELDAPLVPPLAFLRDLGRTFVTRLCAVPDLEDRRERVVVDCPTDERGRLAAAVPPMDGGEYVDADWIAARWTDLNRAFADEIGVHDGPVAEWLCARGPGAGCSTVRSRARSRSPPRAATGRPCSTSWCRSSAPQSRSHGSRN